MKLNFFIHGMQNENQILELQESLMKMEGIEDIDIDFHHKKAAVEFTEEIEERQIRDRIELMGFEVFQVLR